MSQSPLTIRTVHERLRTLGRLDAAGLPCETALPILSGLTLKNEPYVIDLVKQPHLLAAGATGTGKSVFLNTLLYSILHLSPHTPGIVLIDPKRVELTPWKKARHVIGYTHEVEEAAILLEGLVSVMEQRYALLEQQERRHWHDADRIVVVVDELADLVLQSRVVERPLVRLAQKARAAGIHLVLATQRPTTDVVTGLLKANVPGRIAFRVASRIDSRVVLDGPGAEALEHIGQAIYRRGIEEVTLQTPFIGDDQVRDFVRLIARDDTRDHKPHKRASRRIGRRIMRGLIRGVSSLVSDARSGLRPA